MNDEQIAPATVSGVCPETGEPYTILAGDKYVCPSGAVIDSTGYAENAEAVEEFAQASEAVNSELTDSLTTPADSGEATDNGGEAEEE